MQRVAAHSTSSRYGTRWPTEVSQARSLRRREIHWDEVKRVTSPDGAGLPDKGTWAGWAGGSTGPLSILGEFGEALSKASPPDSRWTWPLSGAIVNVIRSPSPSCAKRSTRLILQGNALVFTSTTPYTRRRGVPSVDVILIGGGAGGAGGTASAFSGGPGGGGGGGGEVHVNIPGRPPKDGEDFASIEITVGAGGARGTVGNPGTGGGDTVFRAGLLTAGGGQGRMTGTGTAPGVGGVGGAG